MRDAAFALRPAVATALLPLLIIIDTITSRYDVIASRRRLHASSYLLSAAMSPALAATVRYVEASPRAI